MDNIVFTINHHQLHTQILGLQLIWLIAWFSVFVSHTSPIYVVTFRLAALPQESGLRLGGSCGVLQSNSYISSSLHTI